jgi:hypothetical protein
VSRDTIKRRHAAGAFPSAFKDEAGAWRVPIEDLLAAELHPGAPSPAASGNALVQPQVQPQGYAPGAQELEVERLRADVRRLQAIADERERTIELLSMALRALPSPPQPAPPAASDAPASDAPAPRRSWWRRT